MGVQCTTKVPLSRIITPRTSQIITTSFLIKLITSTTLPSFLYQLHPHHFHTDKLTTVRHLNLYQKNWLFAIIGRWNHIFVPSYRSLWDEFIYQRLDNPWRGSNMGGRSYYIALISIGIHTYRSYFIILRMHTIQSDKSFEYLSNSINISP